MEWLKNLKIAHKLMFLISISLLFVLMVGCVGFVYINKSNVAIQSLYADNLLAIKDLSTIRINANACNANLLAMLLSDTYQKKQNYYNEIKERGKENTEILEKIKTKELTSKEKDILSALDEDRTKYLTSRDKVAKAAFASNQALGLNIYRNETKSVFNEYVNKMAEIVDFNAKMAQDADSQNKKDGAFANTVLIITLLTSFGLLLSLGLMISGMITKPIKQAVGELEGGAHQVAAASTQLSSASEQLAAGTSEQAAAVQETSSTLEETSSMVHQNRENTQQAAVLAKQAKQFAEQSNGEMGRMSVSMTELKNSSNEIAKIIKVIDEIAFQTNILSLNAAVEAARAGDAGKGFAVVAEEVRNLAQRSAQAAKDTAVIIESNINLSDASVDIAKSVKDSVESIGEQAAKVSDLLDEISVATNEQAQGVEQINKAVSQMEIALGTNAKTAEEAASASRELSSQAASVKDIVQTLLVLVEGTEALAGHYQRQSFISAAPQLYLERSKATSNVRIAKNSQSPESVIPLNDF